jgi:dTDP-4-amino-4,6-dideoxygalactose transaminase
MRIDLMRPRLPTYEELAPYIKAIDQNGFYTNFGPLNEELISRLSVYFNVSTRNVHTVSNATQGINGAVQILESFGQDRKNEFWDLPSWTFTATPAALLQANAMGQFCDIDSEWRVKPSFNTDKIIDVLPFGDAIRANPLSTSYKYKIIDGAASFDALKNVGDRLDSNTVLIISMHATKLLAGGEGGIVITKNNDWSDQFHSWTNFGFMNARNSVGRGTNAKISEYTAAITLASLDKWESTKAKIMTNSNLAIEITKDLKLTTNPSLRAGFATPYWILQCESINQKKSFISRLESENVQTRDWWESGCHNMEGYATIRRNDLVNTEILAAKTIGLPFHYFMEEKDFSFIHGLLKALI